MKTSGGMGYVNLPCTCTWWDVDIPCICTHHLRGVAVRMGVARLVCCVCPSQNQRPAESCDYTDRAARFWTKGTCSKFFVIEVKKHMGLNFKMEISSHSSWILEIPTLNNMGKTTHDNPKMLHFTHSLPVFRGVTWLQPSYR